MKKVLFLFFVLCMAMWAFEWFNEWVNFIKWCAIYRGGECVSCLTKDIIPVAVESNCYACANRQTQYVSEGLVPGWACLPSEPEEGADLLMRIDATECPWMRPLKDMVGNCWSCETHEPVLLFDWQQGEMCSNRYYLPDKLGVRSLSCPLLSLIKDVEVCVQCGGVMVDNKCQLEGENHFCKNNHNCGEDEWCYPFRIARDQAKGVCVKKSEKLWFCSATDGYDFSMAEEICARQDAHIPTIEEITAEASDVLESCKTRDAWVFWGKENAVWLQSFLTEFLFTRENERSNLGGRTFHVLCRQN